MALLLVGRITLGDRPFSGWSPALAVATGALALLAAWTLLSAGWSGAPSRAMIEFDRALAYVLVLAFMGSFATRAGNLDRVLGWVALVIAAVAVAALITRLYPVTFPTGAGKSPARLEFPVTYWNALGVFCAIGSVLALHCTAGARQPAAVRVLAAGALPVLATTLYFTFSRGGIVAAAIGVVAYVALAHPRRLPVALLASAIPTFVAVRVAYGADGLATEEYARFTGQAADVTLAVAACALGAMALRALGLLADRRLDRGPSEPPHAADGAGGRRRGRVPRRRRRGRRGRRAEPPGGPLGRGVHGRHHPEQRRRARPPGRGARQRPRRALARGLGRLPRRAADRHGRGHVPARVGPRAPDPAERHGRPFPLRRGARRARPAGPGLPARRPRGSAGRRGAPAVRAGAARARRLPGRGSRAARPRGARLGLGDARPVRLVLRRGGRRVRGARRARAGHGRRGD